MSDGTCRKCGNNLYGNKSKCPFCGEPINSNSSFEHTYTAPQSKSNNNYNYSRPKPVNRTYTSIDNGGFGWGLLGFCFPIVGIVLYFVWRDEKPNTASSCITGALISIALSFFSAMVSGCSAAI